MDYYRLFGFAGLVLITLGVLTKVRRKQDIYFIIGGLSLEIYSISIGDQIFMALQLIFTIAAVYDYITVKDSLKN